MREASMSGRPGTARSAALCAATSSSFHTVTETASPEASCIHHPCRNPGSSARNGPTRSRMFRRPAPPSPGGCLMASRTRMRPPDASGGGLVRVAVLSRQIGDLDPVPLEELSLPSLLGLAVFGVIPPRLYGLVGLEQRERELRAGIVRRPVPLDPTEPGHLRDELHHASAHLPECIVIDVITSPNLERDQHHVDLLTHLATSPPR